MSCDSEHNKFDITKKECYTYALPLTFLEWKFLLKLLFTGIRIIIGQSHDFWRAYRVASFAPERSKVANDATRDTIITRQKSCDYHYIIICNTVHKAKSLPQRAK